MIDRLSDPQIENSLKSLPGWEKHTNRHAIQQSFKFKDFKEAWDFMSKIALLAEEMDHHPEWSNIYNRVDIILTTHDANGISERDIKMAQHINNL
jgi:4a-hydroxytetrahydrobiopterin dehydratase